MKSHFSRHFRRCSCGGSFIAWMLLLVAIALFLSIGQPEAAIVWNGPLISYTQPGTDATQPANQDRITADVWLTRNDIMGLYNAANETTYAHFYSPSNTEWAYGELVNYASLSYTNWESWNGGARNLQSMIGRDAVVHLISDDIYLLVNFSSWPSGGGPFSYTRSTPSLTSPPPAAPVLQASVQAGANLFQITFTNLPHYSFTVRGTTNLSLALTNWTVLGEAVDSPAGSGVYQFFDIGAVTNQPRRFYRVTWP